MGEVEKRSVKCTGLASHASLMTMSEVKSKVQGTTQVVIITKKHIKDNMRYRHPDSGG